VSGESAERNRRNGVSDSLETKGKQIGRGRIFSVHAYVISICALL